jgi:DNA-binding NarL/FixJ family response regulator
MADLDQPANPETLTEREYSIMRLLDEGLSDRDIAAKLFITPGTVKWYNRQIYGKLGVVRVFTPPLFPAISIEHIIQRRALSLQPVKKGDDHYGC